MLLKFFYDENLAQASYLLACPGSGEALVIDPSRDIAPYLNFAKARGLRIVGAAETHIHADYVSGGRELAAATGATLYLSGHGDEFGYKFNPDNLKLHFVKDGDQIRVGKVRLDVMHTPGHTPEHVIYIVTDSSADRPAGIFSGDFLFVGDVGRPDLLEAAVGVKDSAVKGAREQFANVQRFKTMADYLQIWPGHGAGSACGKALGDVPSTTLGYEKLFNPAFQFTDEAAFVDWLLTDQPAVPRYFEQMKKVNQRGAPLLATLAEPKPVSEPKQIRSMVDESLIIDTRALKDFAEGHIPGSIGIPASSSQFNTYVGWYVNYDLPTYIVAERRDVNDVLTKLRAIGVDNVPAYIPADIAGAHTGLMEPVSAVEAHDSQSKGAFILDVRTGSERAEEFIAETQHIPMGEILQRLSSLPPDRDIIVQCGSGVRSQVVASLLKRHGFKRVFNMDGGLDAWKKAGLPLEKGA